MAFLAGTPGELERVIDHIPDTGKRWRNSLGFTHEAAVEFKKTMTHKYQRGDYVKVEFTDEVTGIGEWMWIRVSHCDDEKQLVFGRLDNEPLNDNGGIELGSELAVSYSQIREHRKPTEFTKQ